MAAATEKSISSLPKFALESITPKFIWLFFTALFFLNLLLRVFYLRYQFVNGDEGIRALTASRLLDGARLYADIVTDKPPATTFFYAAVFALFGRSMQAIHLVAVVWNFFTSIIIFQIASLVYNKRAGLLSALLFVYFGTNYYTQDMMAANIELLMMLPYSASFYFYLRAVSSDSAKRLHNHQTADDPKQAIADPRNLDAEVAVDAATFSSASLYLLVAGLLTGVAVVFKQLGAFNIFFFVACELFLLYQNRQNASFSRLFLQSFKRLVLLASGVTVVFAALVLWLHLSGTLTDFWRYVFVLNTVYIDSLSTDLWLKFMVNRIFGYIGFNLALWTLAVWTMWRAVARLFVDSRKGQSDNPEWLPNQQLNNAKRDQRTKKVKREGSEAQEPVSLVRLNAEFAVLLWALLSLAAVFASGRFFGHYFIQALPALAILAARSFELLMERLQTPILQRSAQAITITLLVVFIFGLVRIHHRTAILAFETLTGTRTRFSASWGMTKREHEAEMVSQALLKRIHTGEPLYIWDYALDIYWRSGCRPAARFLTPNHLTGDFTDAEIAEDRGQGDFWKQNRQLLLADLRRNQPRIILDPTGGIEYLPYAEIVAFVQENYVRDGELGIDPARPFVVYKLKER